jgi:MFS family permease
MLSGIFPVLVIEYARLSPFYLSLFYVIATVVAFSGPIFGWLSDHVGNKFVLTVRSVANIVSSFLYIVAPNAVGFTIGRALDDLGKAAFKPAWGSLMAEFSSRDKRRRARMFGYMTSGEDAGEIAGPLLAGAMATGVGIPAMLGARIVFAAATEVYTVAVSHKYLEPAPKGAGRAIVRRLELPARVVAGILVGFGTGWMVSDLQQRSSQREGELSSSGPRSASGAKSCTGNPTIDAIREQTGGC